MKQIRKRIGRCRKTPDRIGTLNRKTESRHQKTDARKSENRADNIRKRDGPDQKTGHTKGKEEPLQWRDGLARVRITTLVEKCRSALLGLWPKPRGERSAEE